MSIAFQKVMLVVALIGATLVSCMSCTPITTNLNRTVIIDRDQDSVKLYPSITRLVTVPKNKKDGSFLATGWAIDKDHIMTAGHFCDHATDLMMLGKIRRAIGLDIVDGIGRPIARKKGWIVNYVADELTDMCIIKSKDHGLTPLPIMANLGGVQTEDKIFIVGAPKGKFPIRRDGYVWAIPDDALLVAIEIEPGNSGGPVMWRGQVVGMIIAVLTDVNQCGIAVRADLLQEFIKATLKEEVK